MRITPRLLFTLAVLFILTPCLQADIKIAVEHSPAGEAITFKAVAPPANNDAATSADFAIVAGERDPNGGELSVLHDGRLAAEEDQPSENFFFRAGTDGGRLRVDLGSVIAVKQVNSYSRHTGTRAPQVYKLYGAAGGSEGFQVAPGRGVAPDSCGWKLIASVDTRPKEGPQGGQYGVSISDPEAGVLGKFRYLLFDMARTEDRDPFGNTFYNEIDVLDANGPAPTTLAASTPSEPILKSFDSDDGKYHFTVDSTAAPDLTGWANDKLRPVIQQWYPKLVAMLPSEGFEAATNVTFRFRTDLGGTPAATGGARVSLNSGWFRRELDREALGSVVHEMVHVVQSYGRARRTNPNATRTPGWLVEGIADYIRWFLYEPQTKGAEITSRNLSRARYDASYRITGNFLNWVTQTYDRDIVKKLNAAAREGKYSEQLWNDATGKTVQELGEQWKAANEQRLKAQSTPN